MSATSRRPRWHPPPPPTPKILHLPRRPRRKPTKQLTGKPHESELRRYHRGKLESLFDEERALSRTVPIVLLNSGDCERRERVEDFEFQGNRGEVGIESEEEKWRFQEEMLRAECNILRMERDIALKKLELNRVQTKRTLRSAVETLISGKEKIYEGKSIGLVLEEEIEDLDEKLKELQKSSSCRDRDRDGKVRKCSNFDKQASVLQRKLEKLGEGLVEEKCVKEIREMTESIKTSCKIEQQGQCDNKFNDVEMLRRKMQVLSRGMLERMEEEYGSILVPSSSCSATSSASTSRRIQLPHSSSHQMLPFHQAPELVLDTNMRASGEESFSFNSGRSSVFMTLESTSREDRLCSGRCKAIVRKIFEQVRAETEQWSRMQEMLGRVKVEMEELQASRDFWQDRAFASADRIQSLESNVKEWKHTAKLSETKVKELEKQISELQLELRPLRFEKRERSPIRKGSLLSMPPDLQKEKEKKVLICSLKENCRQNGNANKLVKDWDDGWTKEHTCGNRIAIGPKRSPLREIGSSPRL